MFLFHCSSKEAEHAAATKASTGTANVEAPSPAVQTGEGASASGPATVAVASSPQRLRTKQTIGGSSSSASGMVTPTLPIQTTSPQALSTDVEEVTPSTVQSQLNREEVAFGVQCRKRFTKKRKASEEEAKNFDRLKAFQTNYEQVLEVGPLSEGLMTFGGRMPRDVYNELRKLWYDHFKSQNLQLWQDVPGLTFQAEARKSFASKCTPRQKAAFLKTIIAKPAVSDAEKLLRKNAEATLEVLEVKSKPSKYESKDVKARVVLLTYNDAKFIFSKFNWVNDKDKLEEPDLIGQLKMEPEVMRLIEYFFKFSKERAEKHHYEWAASIEVSPSTYVEKGICRLHLSLVLGSAKTDIRFRSPWVDMSFGTVIPVYTPTVNVIREAINMKRHGFQKVFGQAAYYAMMPKLFSVASAGSKLPFKDFPIAQTSITSYLQVLYLAVFFFFFVPSHCFFLGGCFFIFFLALCLNAIETSR